eukprot:TRINITY_DN18450_c0_g1_i1.p1 TRINITY_DN18450_c0_g1~~TRINITY_DN18450_c0_g1_i1.p1  ORF type:complete len:495 (-),score=84.36 TRINITY_DN18450_c0_g1_i1:70-1554(-)
MENIARYVTPSYTIALVGCTVLGTALVGWLVGDQTKNQPQQQQFQHDGMPMSQHSQQLQHSQSLIPNEAEAEQKLQAMMGSLSTMMAGQNLEGAERLGEEILIFTEKVWGKDHLNYGLLLGIPLANIYQLKGNMDKYKDSLRRAYEILEPNGTEYVIDTGIVEKLMDIYSSLNEHKKNVKYASILVKARKEALKANPSLIQLAESYCSGLLKAAYALSNAGSFKQAEAHYEEAIKVISNFDPTHTIASNALEYWTNALHQQGKTREAIIKLEEHKRKISNTHRQQQQEVIQKILHRAATLLFTIDDFEETRNYLNQLVQFSKEKKLPISIQMWCDLATVYWELDNEKEASETQTTMKTILLNRNYPSIPLTRSKYLYTTECTIYDGVYSLTMRVNRERPQRKEGEEVEQAEQIKRKIEQCFLEVTFEPTQPNGEHVTITQVVDKPHQFVIKSPKMTQPEANKLYEVCVNIYSDQTKSQHLGTHHQLVYSIVRNN